MTVTVRVPAKINLHLGVGAAREDGYHPLVTVFQAIGLCDDVTAVRSDDWSVAMTPAAWMTDVALPARGDNIVDRAGALLAAHHGLPQHALVSISKLIPMAGGMAGGSADAAGALVALDRLWGAGTRDEDLMYLAAELGSDVPFLLVGGTALGTGRGEVVTPLHDRGTWWWVVVPSSAGLSTPEVYRHFDRLSPDAPPTPVAASEVVAALRTGDPHRLAPALHNDLQPAAVDLRPELGRLLELGEGEGALRGLVSGSGPTCVFLCESGDAARAVAGALRAHDHPVVLVANGPVAGAHFVRYDAHGTGPGDN